MLTPPYVVFRFSKLKDAGKINAAHGHNSRIRPTHNANPSVQNVVIKPCDDAYLSVIKTIGNQTIRKNAVLAMEIIISASPRYFRPECPEKYGFWDDDKLKLWREAMEPWILAKFPNAVSVILHLDEATPHYQVLDVPLDIKGKLNARSKFGGDNKMDAKRWQDWAAEPVAHLGIVRGIEGSSAKHEAIKHYYSRINTITPIPTLPPEPLPPSLIERTNEGLIKFANNERTTVYKSINETFKTLAAKAKVVDLSVAQKNAAIATADKLAKEKTLLKKSADLVRLLPIDDVLKRVFDARLAKVNKFENYICTWIVDATREIVISRDDHDEIKWMEKGGKYQRGAINLTMHLADVSYTDAVRLLLEHYDNFAIAAEQTAQFAKQVLTDVKSLRMEPLNPPLPVIENWPRLRKYLTDVHGLPSKFIDWLHQRNLVYADKQSNAIFPKKKGGAFILGTSDKPFYRTYGSKTQGHYVIEGSGDIWLCESALNAISIKAHSSEAHIIALGEALLNPSGISLPTGRKIILAFNLDSKGRRFREDALKIWPAAKTINPPSGKDWSFALQNNSELMDQRWRSSAINVSTVANKMKLGT